MERRGSALGTVVASSDNDGDAVAAGVTSGFDPLRERWLILNTGLAEAMFHGRPGVKHPSPETGQDEWRIIPIIGLRQFGRLLRRIWLEATRGDPYAHWWLIRIEEAFEEAEREMFVSTQLYEARLAEGSILEVGVLESLEAHQHQIRFINPLGNRGANLLGKFDRFLNVILECQQQALISVDDVKRLQRAARGSVLRVFSSVFGYWAFGVTRTEVVTQTARARRAQEHMGAVPRDILMGTRSAACAPRWPSSRSSTPSKIKLKNYRLPPQKFTTVTEKT